LAIGSEQTIKAGIGYGINSGDNSVFVAPIDSDNIENVNSGDGVWLAGDFASGALFTNVLNPSAMILPYHIPSLFKHRKILITQE